MCTKQRARLTLHWPNMDNNIENVVAACRQCQDDLSSNNREILVTKSKPERLFQETASNLCYISRRLNAVVTINVILYKFIKVVI